MPIDRQVYPEDFSKFQAEHLIRVGLVHDSAFKVKAVNAGFVFSTLPGDDEDDIFLEGSISKLRGPMRTLWAQTPAYVRALFYVSYMNSCEDYLRVLMSQMETQSQVVIPSEVRSTLKSAFDSVRLILSRTVRLNPTEKACGNDSTD